MVGSLSDQVDILEATVFTDDISSLTYDDDGDVSGFPFSLTGVGEFTNKELFSAGKIITIVSGTSISTGDFIIADSSLGNTDDRIVLTLSAGVAGDGSADINITATTGDVVGRWRSSKAWEEYDLTVHTTGTFGGGNVVVDFDTSPDDRTTSVNIAGGTTGSITTATATQLTPSGDLYKHVRANITDSLTGTSAVTVIARIHGRRVD